MNVAAQRLRRLIARRETRVVAGLLILLCSFLALLIAVRGDWLPGADLQATLFLQKHRSGALDAIATMLTYSGGGAVLVPVGLLAALWLARSDRRRTAFLVLLSLLGHPLNYEIKLIADRARPTSEQVAVLLPASGTSFPSGHAMATVITYGFLAVLCAVLLPSSRLRRGAVSALVTLTILIGLSRVYLGDHWASDVLGGWVCGLFFLVVLVELHRFYAASEVR